MGKFVAKIYVWANFALGKNFEGTVIPMVIFQMQIRILLSFVTVSV